MCQVQSSSGLGFTLESLALLCYQDGADRLLSVPDAEMDDAGLIGLKSSNKLLEESLSVKSCSYIWYSAWI
jgi:hypothetical protein